MRGLLGLLLAPALTAGLVVPEIEEWKGETTGSGNDRAMAVVGVNVPGLTDDARDANIDIRFKLEVLRSEEACGLGNILIDGQALPQTLEDEVSSGKGLLLDNVFGSWSFYCIKVNGVPDSQLMKFTVDKVDGKSYEHAGFSVLFRQAGEVAIMNIEHDLSVPDELVANPNPEALQPADDTGFDVEEEVAELEYLWSQLREIKYLIHEKERTLAHHGRHQGAVDLKECDSLKCIARALADHAKHAAHEIYEKMRGDFDDEEDSDFEEFGKKDKKKHSKDPKPKHPKGPKGGKNCTDGGPPKHGHGNHTGPPPPWKRPHHRPLPICRYPPPPPHHGFPHGKPPGHHGHDHEERPPFGGPDHHQGPPDFDGPPHHGKGRPEHDRPPPPGDRPDFEGHRPQGPPDFDGPHHDDPKHDYEQGPPGPPPHDRPDSPPPHDGPHGGPPEPPPHFEQFGAGGPRPHGPSNRALQITKFTTIGFIFAFLLIALHRRCYTPARRADRQSRRERRRAYRRAAHKNIINKLLLKIGGGEADDEEGDYEEKRERLISEREIEAEEGLGGLEGGTRDIREMRTSAEVAGEMIIADHPSNHPPSTLPLPAITTTTTTVPQTPTPSPQSETPLQQHDLEVVGGEELPAYEDNDGSDDSSIIADGFRYQPGSVYTPSTGSETGSISDVLGDTKS